MKTERQPIIKRGVADTARPHASLPTVCAACVEERDHLEAIKRQHDAERESWAKEKPLKAPPGKRFATSTRAQTHS